jgi:hypothetical protein
LQIQVDLLNTSISQAPLTRNELADASSLHRRSNASSTPRLRALFQPSPPQPSCPPPYYYPPYPYPPHPISDSLGGNAHPPYPYSQPPVGGSSDDNATSSYPYLPPLPYGYPPYSYFLPHRWFIELSCCSTIYIPSTSGIFIPSTLTSSFRR